MGDVSEMSRGLSSRAFFWPTLPQASPSEGRQQASNGREENHMPLRVKKTPEVAGVSNLRGCPWKMDWRQANCWSLKLRRELWALTGTGRTRGKHQ